MRLLDRYEEVVGHVEVKRLRQLAARLQGKRIVHVNSTRTGGGVAEILNWMVPLMQELGLQVRWEVISGPPDFYRVTKAFHNGLQGLPVTLTRFGIDPDRPLLVQVSRFDRFKDPLGVIQAYRLLKPYYPEVQLVLAGGTADDDPEGAEVLKEVKDNASDDDDLKILLLPPD